MGWYLRRSVKFGPLRLNLSKSGIGYSLGVKGFRVGNGPRGPYVAGGRYGIYYRQYLKSGVATGSNSTGTTASVPPSSVPVSSVPAYCTHCGTPIVPGNLFCIQCGARLEEAGSGPVFEPERSIQAHHLLWVLAGVLGLAVLVGILREHSPPAPSVASTEVPKPLLPDIPVVKPGTTIQPGPNRLMELVLRSCGKPSQIRQDGKIMIWEYARRGLNLNWALPVSDDEKASHDGGPWLLTVQDRKNGSLHDVNERTMVLHEMPCIRAALSATNPSNTLGTR